MMRWLVLSIFFLNLKSPACCGEKPKPASAREIKALIDQLVSPNRIPLKVSAAHGLPRDFDRQKQKQVDRAIARLLQLGPQAFPFLIERWGDKRYCLTASDNISGAFLHMTVGQVCRAVVFDQLQPYGHWPAGHNPDRNRRPPHRPRHPDAFLRTQELARQWWKKNKHKALYRMQLDVLDWVMAEEAKRPQDFKEAERKQLQQIRKNLVQGGKPLPVSRVGGYDGFQVEKD
jgi:hypothetical protein